MYTATNIIMPMATAATSLRQALADPEAFVVAPGVYDGFSARIALGAGFNALYMVSGNASPATIKSANKLS